MLLSHSMTRVHCGGLLALGYSLCSFTIHTKNDTGTSPSLMYLCGPNPMMSSSVSGAGAADRSGIDVSGSWICTRYAVSFGMAYGFGVSARSSRISIISLYSGKVAAMMCVYMPVYLSLMAYSSLLLPVTYIFHRR